MPLVTEYQAVKDIYRDAGELPSRTSAEWLPATQPCYCTCTWCRLQHNPIAED